jgi:hypothetical protein
MGMVMDCWICGSHANTGEHIVKRSDLDALFPAVTQSTPIFLQREPFHDRKVGSLRSSKLTHSAKICARCNNSLTQLHDKAWQRLSAALQLHAPKLKPGAVFRTHNAFPNHTHCNLLKVHLFFLKAFGCMIESGGVAIPLAPFSDAILKGHAHPNVYLKFGIGIDEAVAAASDMWVDTIDNEEVVYATWIYQVGRIWVNLIFALEGQDRDGLIGAWHPRQHTSKFVIADFVNL